MKYRFCSIRINVTKYYVTFATKGGLTTPYPVATPLEHYTWYIGIKYS